MNALPFPDASFDLAFCQQGLQFFPQKLAALEEIGRVLTPAGSIILTVWSSVSPLVTALADALRRYVSDEAAQSALAPNEFSDSEVIKALLAEAGFQAIRREILRFDRNIGPAQESIPKEMAGSPYWDAVMKLDRAAKDALVNDVGEALLEFQNISGFAIPQETHMIRAMKC